MGLADNGSMTKAITAAAITHQYIALDDKPVALLTPGKLGSTTLYAVHTDHRNAPLALTDEQRQVVWQAKVSDFGYASQVGRDEVKRDQAKRDEASRNEANSDQANRDQATLGKVTYNLRASNQYFDAETNLHYNTHRYFDPIAQRYLTPDPLGLAVGPDLYAFALNRPHELSDPLGLAPTTAKDWSKATYEDKLLEIISRAIPLVPGEIGAALAEIIKPANLAIMGAVFGVWLAAQATPIGWVADLALLGYGIWTAGSGVLDLFKTFIALDANSKNAKCENDIDAAAKALAKGFVAGSGEVAGGLAGVWGVKATGGFTRIANGIKTVIDFGKRQIGKITTPLTATYTRPNTSTTYPANLSPWKNVDGSWKYPPNDGFAGASSPIGLPKGTLFDRFGGNGNPVTGQGGGYVSPVGTPFPKRALPPASAGDPYTVFRVVKDIPKDWVQGGEIAGWFGQPGGGIQYKLTRNVQWLIDNGYIQVVLKLL
jgi:RHS repeat-associated protein